MGDWHQQHIDWSYTEQTGLERPIAHGVSSAGVAMRHAISLLFPGHPEAMTRFKCRFTSPVLPGVRLRTEVWRPPRVRQGSVWSMPTPRIQAVPEQLHRGVGYFACVVNYLFEKVRRKSADLLFIALFREICPIVVVGSCGLRGFVLLSLLAAILAFRGVCPVSLAGSCGFVRFAFLLFGGSALFPC